MKINDGADYEIWVCLDTTGASNAITVNTSTNAWDAFAIEFNQPSTGYTNAGGSVTDPGYLTNQSMTVSAGAAGNLVVVGADTSDAYVKAPAAPWSYYNSGYWSFKNGTSTAWQVATSSSPVTATWETDGGESNTQAVVLDYGGSTPPTTTTTTTPPPGNETCTSANSDLGPYPQNSAIANSNGYNTYVANQDVGANSVSTMTTCDIGDTATDFTVTANAGPSGYGGVQYYPDLQQLWTTTADTGQPVSGFTTLQSSFTSTDPADSAGNWEEAYDLWFDDLPNDVMIWVNTSASRLADNGAVVDNPNVSIDGVSYTLMHFGSSAQPERMLVLNTNESSGTVNILADVQYLQGIGDIPSGAGFEQINFGWEICSTVGSQTFALNNYSLTAST